MANIYEILRGNKDSSGSYQKMPVIVQGITGTFGSLHAKMMMEYGTNIAAGVTPVEYHTGRRTVQTPKIRWRRKAGKVRDV